jgi:replication factor A2
MNYGGYGDSFGNAGGGGGFDTSTQSQTSPSGQKQIEDSIRPITIKQLLDAQPTPSNDELIIDGKEVHTVTFIGKVRNVAVQPTRIVYKLDDGTGTFEVKEWVRGEPGDNRPAITENQYARVMGRPRLFQTSKQLWDTVLRPITDFNEVSYHLLEATYVHLYYTKGPINEDGLSGTTAGQSLGQTSFNTGVQDAGPGGDMRGLSPLARKVINVLMNSEQNNEGLHVQEIAARLGVDAAELIPAGAELQDTSKIYTTVDDETWKLLF